MKDKNQKQEGGNSSTNLQSESIVINQGLTYSDVKEIALDVYEANFIQLSKDAEGIARKRAEEITKNFLEKLEEKFETIPESMNEPSMQAALYEAQKQYAKTGDKDLEELLVDILVERAGESERTIHQIVLDESLTSAGKLTSEQMDALSLNFLISQTIDPSIHDIEEFKYYLNNEIIPFVDGLSDNRTCYQHLEYVGCISIMHVSGLSRIEDVFQDRYRGLFSSGFTKEKFELDVGSFEKYKEIITHCIFDNNLYQLIALNFEELKDLINNFGFSSVASELTTLFKNTTLSKLKVKEHLIEYNPKMEKLFDIWNNSLISKSSLTTVGIAIAQANFRRKTGIKLDLSCWVN